MALVKLRVRTWIPTDKVLLMGTTGGNLYYKGDTRTSASWDSSQYRTFHEFIINTADWNIRENIKKVSGTTSYFYDTSKRTNRKRAGIQHISSSFLYIEHNRNNAYI